jgi:hypothetical protein
LFSAELKAGVNGGGGDVENGFQMYRFIFDNGIIIPLFLLTY